jgi:hypothetical protein
MEEVKDVNFRKILQDLKDNLPNSPLLNGVKTPKQICEIGLEFVAQREKLLKLIIDYVFEAKKQGKIVRESELFQFMQAFEIKHDNAKGRAISNLWTVTKTPLFLCGFEKAKTIINSKMDKANVVTQELLDLVLRDNTEEGMKMQSVMVEIFTEILKVK